MLSVLSNPGPYEVSKHSKNKRRAQLHVTNLGAEVYDIATFQVSAIGAGYVFAPLEVLSS
jgi:hypothetical protein